MPFATVRVFPAVIGGKRNLAMNSRTISFRSQWDVPRLNWNLVYHIDCTTFQWMFLECPFSVLCLLNRIGFIFSSLDQQIFLWMILGEF